MLRLETIHHVALSVSDLERARGFYAGVLGLEEIARPPFDFPGAWFVAGDRELHLIAGQPRATLRGDRPLDTRDGHIAIRVASYAEAVAHFAALGYVPDADDEMRRTREQRHATAGFPQLYVLDPDRNVIEINAARLDDARD